MKKYLQLMMGILLITVIVSCNKKWKQTANVDFHFHIAKPASGSNVEFTSGTMTINEFDFSGDRVKGGGVNFANPMSNGNVLNFDNGFGNPPIAYDIPQGTYSRMTIGLATNHQSAHNANISIKGIYTHGDTSVPIVLKFNEAELFNANVQTQSGNPEITIVEGTPATCDVSIDPSAWFATVPTSLFNSVCSGTTLITISEEENEAIYNIVKTRVGKNTTAIIK
jgi:hypothetical protein